MLTINVKIKNQQGTTISRKIRDKNSIPCIIYGKNIKPISVVLNHKNFVLLTKKNKRILQNTLNILINEKKIKVKIQAVQYHPCNIKIIHIDFMQL
ncbi:MAG: 50S ribosomal subunit protein L25 [Candidatus Westeberhardia cardiocondylae]|nr:50S ribosomal subunit protein L25 [Candidatus Westeberhardia cardiocondylae]